MKINFKYEIKSTEKVNESGLLEIILKNRRIKDLDKFLQPENPAKIHLTDFGPQAGGLTRSLKLLQRLRDENKMIVVYTDYDADGITGGAILWETLYLLGFKAMPYVPHRKLEGYGFSIKGIDNVKKQYNPSLIISVDHGITARDKVSYAKKLGIPVIITDHHLKPEKLPDDAFSIFHITALSGSGVAYFFAKAIFEYFKSPTTNYQLLTTNFQTDYLSLASIGTIADLVPLIGPSRSIVKFGLKSFSLSSRVGLKHILKEAGIEGRKITPYEIGFIIAPRINAVGRLEHAIDALRLLCTKDSGKAFQLASRVGNTNKQRQDLVDKSLEEAKNILKHQTSDYKKLPKIIIIKNAHFHEGIIGLIASKMVEEFYRPAIIISENDGQLKGSARSIPGFHITNFLRDHKKYLIDVGGHAGAAGFTMEKAKYNRFVTIVSKWSEKLIKAEDLERKIEADLKIPLVKVNLRLALKLETMEPFGIGNPKPTFLSDVEIIDLVTFGKTKDHLKLYVRDSSHSFPFELIYFSGAKKMSGLKKGQKIQVVYTVDIDRWGGNERLRGRINYFQLK